MQEVLKAEILRTAIKVIEKGYSQIVTNDGSTRQLSLNPNDIAIVYNEIATWLGV